MMKITARKSRWLAALLALAWIGGTSLQAAPAPQRRAQLTALDNRPLAFEENHGQTDPQVKYLSRGQRYTLFLTPAEAVLALHSAGRNQAGSVLRVRWVGGAAAPRMAPGADPNRLRLAFAEAEELRIDAVGDLVARVGGEEVRLHRPVSYQEVEGVRRTVESSWRLIPGAFEATSTAGVRAERAGSGDGRVYSLTFTATDPQGAACSGTVNVCVPHDLGKPACGHGGMP